MRDFRDRPGLRLRILLLFLMIKSCRGISDRERSYSSKSGFLDTVSALRLEKGISSISDSSESSAAISGMPEWPSAVLIVVFMVEISVRDFCVSDILDRSRLCYVSMALPAEVAPKPVLVAPVKRILRFLRYLKPFRSSKLRAPPYYRSSVNSYSTSGKRLKSRTKLARSSFLISVNFISVSNMSSGTLERT